MTSRRVLMALAALFLILGFLGLALRSSYEPEPVVPIAFLVLGTACVAFLAYLSRNPR